MTANPATGPGPMEGATFPPAIENTCPAGRFLPVCPQASAPVPPPRYGLAWPFAQSAAPVALAPAARTMAAQIMAAPTLTTLAMADLRARAFPPAITAAITGAITRAIDDLERIAEEHSR